MKNFLRELWKCLRPTTEKGCRERWGSFKTAGFWKLPSKHIYLKKQYFQHIFANLTSKNLLTD